MKSLAIAVALLTVTACTSIEKQASHQNAQIDIVRIQREAQLQERVAESEAKKALYQALQAVATANPDHAPAVTVALAVQGLGNEEEGSTQIVQLQRQQNEALEYVKALTPTVGNLVSGLGVAAINASVTKNAQNANREIMLGDQQQNARIVEAVAGLGTVAASNAGVTAGGDYYSVQDQGFIDNSVNTADSNNTATTSVADSYNSADTNQTYTASDNAFVNAGVADYTDYIIDYQGSDMTLGQLISTLQAANASYSIDLDGDGTPDVEGDGDGETITINCNEPQFSPAPPECS